MIVWGFLLCISDLFLLTILGLPHCRVGSAESFCWSAGLKPFAMLLVQRLISCGFLPFVPAEREYCQFVQVGGLGDVTDKCIKGGLLCCAAGLRVPYILCQQ